MEDGVAFCPHCGAPQIRVSAVAADEPVAPAFPRGVPGELQSAAPPVGISEAPPGRISWSQGVRASALAGLLLALAIFFVPVIAAGIGLSLHLGQAPIGLLVLLASWCCMLLAGVLAVRFYRRRCPETEITTGMGARLGALTGLLGFLFYGFPQALRLAFFHLSGSVRDAMQRAMEQSAAQSADPRAQELMRSLTSPAALAAFFTVLVVLFFLFFVVLSSVGGTIGASAWGRKQSRG